MPPKLIVEVLGDTSRLDKSFRHVGDSAKGLSGTIGHLSIGIGQLVKGVIVVDALAKAFEGLSAAVHLGIGEFTESTKIAAQTQAAIKSTGGIAGVTAKHIDDLSLALSNLSGIDDEAIKSGENLLLSFTNIRNSAGKGNDIFDQATKAVTNFAARTGRDVPAAALVLGKALEDPAKRLASLSRAGIVFSASQTKAITALEKTKGILAAQKVLLAELTKRYGGAAAAAGKTLPGALGILRDRFKDLVGGGIKQIDPALTAATVSLSRFVVKLTEAKGASAKVDVLFSGIKNAARGLEAALGNAVRGIDWGKVWAQAQGIGEGLQKRLGEINFELIGKRIGDGIASAIKVAVPAVAQLADRITQVISNIDWDRVGKTVGPGLATAIATAFATLTDPKFWLKHWDLALSVGSVAFGGAIGRVVGRFAAPLAELGAKIGGDLALAITAPLERLSGALAAVVLRGLIGLPALVSRVAIVPIERAFAALGRRLGSPLFFVVKVIGVNVAIHAVENLIVQLKNAVSEPLGILFQISGVSAALANVKKAVSLIGDAITGDFAKIWKALETQAVNAALAIVEPFSHLPKALGGGPFQAMKVELTDALASMAKTGGSDATAVGASVAAGVTAGFAGGFAGFAANLKTAIDAAVKSASAAAKTATRTATAAATSTQPPVPISRVVIPQFDLGGTPTTRPGVTATQRNTFFDNAVSRLLDRSQDGSIQSQIAKLQNIAGLITKRIAATKDVTRRLNLEDRLVEINRNIAGKRDELAQNFLDSLQLNVDKASATQGIGDDIAAINAANAGIRARIAALKNTGQSTSALESQIVSNNQQIASLRQQQGDDAFAKLSGALQLRIDKAALTRTTADDISAINAWSDRIRKRIAQLKNLGRDTSDLASQLVSNQSSIRDLKQQAGDDAFAKLSAALQLRIDRATLTRTTSDDIASINAWSVRLRKRIAHLRILGRDTSDLESQLVTNASQIRGLKQQASDDTFARLSDALQLRADKAALTKTNADNIAVINASSSAIRKRIAALKRNHDDVSNLEDQLVTNAAQIRGLKQQASQDAFSQLLAKLNLGIDRAAATLGSGDDIRAFTKLRDVIRKRIKTHGESVDLAEKLLDANNRIKAIRVQNQQDALAKVFDRLNLNVDLAAVTKSQVDDLRANDALQAGIRAQIKKHGRTTELVGQLLDAQQKERAILQQQAQNRADLRNAGQFKTLGLTATGGAITPGVDALRRQLGSVENLVAGTFLDTTKTQSVLSKVAKVLSGGLGVVGKQVRDQVKTILDGINQQLENNTGDRSTKFHKTNVNRLLAAAGLDPKEVDRVASALSRVGAGGTIAGRGQGAFGIPLGKDGRPIVVQTTVNLDGRKVATSTTKHQQTRDRLNPVQKRGQFQTR